MQNAQAFISSSLLDRKESINKLLSTNVNNHTEKKGNLTYLSWAWAWAEALKADEDATYKVEMFGDKCYMDINGTAMVFVTVTMFRKAVTCQLPVMDFKNKAILNPDAFAVNTAIMRCMTKALGLFGLGLYIYAGEDLPADEEPEVKVVKRKEVPAGEVPRKEDMRLFADSMIQYTNICESVEHLNSYWKANQGQLDILNSVHPDMYEEVLTKFKQLKASFKEKTSE